MKKIKPVLRIAALALFTAILLGLGSVVPRYLTDRKVQRLSKTDTAVDINEVKPFGIESLQIVQTIQNTRKDLETYNSINSGNDGYDMYVKAVSRKKVNLESVNSIMNSLSPHFKGNWGIDGTQLFIPKGRKADNCDLAIVTIKNKIKNEVSYFDFFVEKKSGIVLQVVISVIPKENGTEYFKEFWEKYRNELSQKIGMPLSDRTAEDNIFDSYLQGSEYNEAEFPFEKNVLNRYTAISLDQQLMLKAGAIGFYFREPDPVPSDIVPGEDGETTASAEDGGQEDMQFLTYIFAIETL